MLNWIAGFVARWAGLVPRAVRDLVHWTVHALAGVVYTVFGHVGGAWRLIFDGVEWIWKHSTAFAHDVYVWVKQIVTVDIPVLWHILLSDVKGLLTEIARIWRMAEAAVQRALDTALLAVSRAVSWATDHIYHPLKAYADQIWNDLLKWGYQSWKLLTDPPRLAAILLGALIAAAESAFWSIAGPAGRFILGVMLHNAGKLVLLLESILTAVL